MLIDGARLARAKENHVARFRACAIRYFVKNRGR
jgi:hypothetical protein